MTRVSIITPFLNAEANLAEAIGSVRAQTVPDWELLLVDDGSTDRSPEIASSAAAADARIRLVPGRPGAPHGPAAARNAGLEAARGEFVAFLDADDLFEPHMLATMLAAAEQYESAALIFGPTLWWHPDQPARDWVETTDGRAGRLHAGRTLLRDIVLLQDGHVPCICSVLVRRSAAIAVQGFNERFKLYEDQTLWVKLLLRYDAFITPVCLSRYRQHPESASAKAAADGTYRRIGDHPARLDFLTWIEGTLRNDEHDSATVDRGLLWALRLARAPYYHDPSIRQRLDRLLFALCQIRTRRRRWLRRLLSRLSA